jgi:hypothetical protein
MTDHPHKNHHYNDGPIGGLAVFVGTLIALAIFASLIGSTTLEIGSVAALDQSTSMQGLQHR